MRISFLVTMMTLATSVAGCQESDKAGQPDASARADVLADTSKPSEPFDLEGKWLYLGPWDDGEHNLTIGKSSIEYSAIAGDWSSTWTLKSYDNQLHRFELSFGSGTGTPFPNGKELSGTYVLNGAILTVQLSQGSGSFLPVESDTCTKDDSTRIVDCRLYMSQN